MNTPAQPTPEQLQAAFARLRKAHWPATLDACLQMPLFAALLRTAALHAPPLATPRPATHAHRLPWRPPRATADLFDARAARAGDRNAPDDDDQ